MSVKLYNPEELPFGLLSNNFPYKMMIDNEEWDNISQYIYTNLIPLENEKMRKNLREIPYDLLPSKYLEYESQIKDDFVKDLLIRGLNQRFESDDFQDYLLNTGNSRIYYINNENLFFGTRRELIPKLKMGDYIESKNVLGEVFEEIRKKIQENIIDTELYNQYGQLKTLNDVVLKDFRIVIDFMHELADIEDDDDKRNKEDKFNDFLKEHQHLDEIDFDEYKRNLSNDRNLLEVLILSKTNPMILVIYSLHKNIRKSCEIVKKRVSKVVLDKYLQFFSETTGVRRKDVEKELKYIKIEYLEKVLLDLYNSGRLPAKLLEDIGKESSRFKILSEQILIEYDNFDIDFYRNDENNEILLKIIEKGTPDLLFTDDNQYLSIFTKDPMIIKGEKFTNVDEYIKKYIQENEFFNNDVRLAKIENLCKIGLNYKFKFEIKDVEYDRETLDFHHILNFAKDMNIVYLDEIPLISTVTSGYLNYHSKNSIDSSKFDSKNGDVQSFIENDLFMKTWIQSLLKNISYVVLNMHHYIEEKYNKFHETDSNFVRDIYKSMFNRKDVNEIKEKTINNQFISEYLDSLFNNDDIKSTIWGFIYNDINFLWNSVSGEDKESEVKEVLYNLQMNLVESKSKYMILDNPLDNAIILSIIYLLQKINKVSKNYLNISDIYNKYSKDFKKAEIKFEDISDLNMDELFKKVGDMDTRENFLIEKLYNEMENKLIINNFDLDNVYSLILNLNSTEKKQSSQGDDEEDLFVYTNEKYDDYENDEFSNEDEVRNKDVNEDDNIENEKSNDDEEEHSNDLMTEMNRNEEFDNDNNDEYEKVVNEMFNDEDENDEYADGAVVNFEQQRLTEIITNFLIKHKIPSKIKCNDIIRLFGFIKMNMKKSQNITLNRCNFFQNKDESSIIDVKRAEKKKIVVDDCSQIGNEIRRISGVSGGKTASETWILDMKNKTKLFCKLFINVDYDKEILFNSEEVKANFMLSSKSLEYEKRVYKEIIGPMRELNVCKHFISVVSSFDSCSYDNIFNMVNGKLYDKRSNEILDKESTERVLKRNINSFINMDKQSKIDDIGGGDVFNRNSELIEDLKYSMVVNKFFDTNPLKGFTFTEFLQQYSNNVETLLKVLFQISVVCYALSLSKMTHNDLHGDNIFIKKLDEVQTLVYYINNKKYMINTFFKVYIFDFNFSYVKKFGKNEGINDFLCENFSVCNKFIENKDILKVLCAVYTFYPPSLKYATTNEENRKSLEELYQRDRQCFFRSDLSTGKSVTNDYFSNFNKCLTILKMIYVDIHEDDIETNKVVEQTLRPILDGNDKRNDLNLSVIDENNHQEDGTLDYVKQQSSLKSVFGNLREDYGRERKMVKERIREPEPIEGELNLEKNDDIGVKEGDDNGVKEGDDNGVKESDDIGVKEGDDIEVKEGDVKEGDITIDVEDFNKKMIYLVENGYMIFKGSEKNVLENFFEEQVEFKSKKMALFSVNKINHSHPSSFHHTELRTIRKNIYEQLNPVFGKYFTNKRVQMLFDCFYEIFKENKKIYCENDFPGEIFKNDLIMRGWINLNKDAKQTFSYKKIEGNDEKEYTDDVPPGHIVLYNISDIKEFQINIDKNSLYPIYRLYFGFRITDDSKPLYPENIEFMKKQAVPIIINGSRPTLYDDKMLEQWPSAIKKHSKKLDDIFLDENKIAPQILIDLNVAQKINSEYLDGEIGMMNLKDWK